MSPETRHLRPYRASDSRRATERTPHEKEAVHLKEYLSVEEGPQASRHENSKCVTRI